MRQLSLDLAHPATAFLAPRPGRRRFRRHTSTSARRSSAEHGKSPAGASPGQGELELLHADKLPAALHQRLERERSAHCWQDPHWTMRLRPDAEGNGWTLAVFANQADGELAILSQPWPQAPDGSPQPLDAAHFDNLRRQAEHIQREVAGKTARKQQKLSLQTRGQRWEIRLEQAAGADHARLSAHDSEGRAVVQIEVAAGFRLDREFARAWCEAGFCDGNDAVA